MAVIADESSAGKYQSSRGSTGSAERREGRLNSDPVVPRLHVYIRVGV